MNPETAAVLAYLCGMPWLAVAMGQLCGVNERVEAKVLHGNEIPEEGV